MVVKLPFIAYYGISPDNCSEITDALICVSLILLQELFGSNVINIIFVIKKMTHVSLESRIERIDACT